MAELVFLCFCPQSPLNIRQQKESRSSIAIGGDKLEDQLATITSDEDKLRS